MDVTDILIKEEGFKDTPYYCSEKYPTIGIGFKLGPKNTPLHYYDFKISKEVAKLLLQERIDEIKEQLSKYDWYNNCNEDRKAILISMAYQLGLKGLLTFTNTLAYIAKGDYNSASVNMLKSKWSLQTPNRARRHATVMRTASLASAYKG